MARVRTFKPSTRIFRSGTQGPRDEWLEEVEKSVRQDRTHLLGRALSCLCFRVYVCMYARYLCTPACACTRTYTCGPACAYERAECAVAAWAGLEAATVPSGYLCYSTTDPADGESAAGKSWLQALCSGEGKKGETQSRRTPLGCSGHKGGQGGSYCRQLFKAPQLRGGCSEPALPASRLCCDKLKAGFYTPLNLSDFPKIPCPSVHSSQELGLASKKGGHSSVITQARESRELDGGCPTLVLDFRSLVQTLL